MFFIFVDLLKNSHKLIAQKLMYSTWFVDFSISHSSFSSLLICWKTIIT